MTKQDIMSALLGILSTTYGRFSVAMSDIGTLRGVSAARMRAAMQALVAVGFVVRTGNTRGTRYQAVYLGIR